MIIAHPLVAGRARGPLMKVAGALSFWGGVDAKTGRIIDPQNERHGKSIAGTVLALAQLRGSSSSSSVLLELIHNGHAPAALIVAEADAILIAGILAAREMGWSYPPLFKLSVNKQRQLGSGDIEIGPDGTVSTP